MKKFSIYLTDENIDSWGELSAIGGMQLGDFEESFHASLSYWTREQYLSQWREAVSRLLSGEHISALITAMYNPKRSNFITWWPMYLVGRKVYIQNQILFLEELETPFNEKELYNFISKRETSSEDGEKISEWCVDIDSLIDFMDKK